MRKTAKYVMAEYHGSPADREPIGWLLAFLN
jgi:hypothetical protein